MSKINCFDFDGVITTGIIPKEGDIVISGRCLDEAHVIYEFLEKLKLPYRNAVFFNPITYELRGNHSVKARTFSGTHKGNTLKTLLNNGVEIENMYEDDPLQAEIMETISGIKPIMVEQTVEL